jgi:hypothetical protein
VPTPISATVIDFKYTQGVSGGDCGGGSSDECILRVKTKHGAKIVELAWMDCGDANRRARLEVLVKGDFLTLLVPSRDVRKIRWRLEISDFVF